MSLLLDDGLGVPVGEELGVGDGVVDGDELGVGDADGLGDEVGLVADGLGLGDPDADGEGLGDADDDGLGVAINAVMITFWSEMHWLARLRCPEEVACASRTWQLALVICASSS